jgi:hypothetical protein
MSFLDSIPEALRVPLIVLVFAHLAAFAVWALFFFKDLILPPAHPIVEESKKKQ